MNRSLCLCLLVLGCAENPSSTESPAGSDPVVTENPPGVDVRPGDLQVTEIMTFSSDCAVEDSPWVELLNTTSAPLSLQGLFISNGVESEALGNITVGPGERVVGVPSSAAACHDFVPDFRYHGVSWWEQSGLLRIRGNGTIDQVDLGGVTLPTDDSWSRQADGRWCASVPTPGEVSAVCSEDLDPEPEPPVHFSTLRESLLISEYNLDSRACGAELGQYIEVKSVTGHRLDLSGIGLWVDGVVVPVDTDVILDSFGRALFAPVGAEACWPDAVVPDGTWQDWSLTGREEVLGLSHSDPPVVVDEIFPVSLPSTPAGVSLALAEDADDARSNDFVANWCMEDGFMADTFQEYGSPGRMNRACNRALRASVDGNELLPGELVITEMMADPLACAAFNAQYFEFVNQSGKHMSPAGLEIRVQDSSFVVGAVQTIPVGETLLVELRVGVAAYCYQGLLHDLVWEGRQFPSGGGTVELVGDLGIIDRVDLSGFATVEGASMELDPSSLTAVGNDDPANWCHAASTFPGSEGDLGSPGVPNPACGLERLGL